MIERMVMGGCHKCPEGVVSECTLCRCKLFVDTTIRRVDLKTITYAGGDLYNYRLHVLQSTGKYPHPHRIHDHFKILVARAFFRTIQCKRNLFMNCPAHFIKYRRVHAGSHLLQILLLFLEHTLIIIFCTHCPSTEEIP